jgi:hypothetical protein
MRWAPAGPCTTTVEGVTSTRYPGSDTTARSVHGIDRARRLDRVSKARRACAVVWGTRAPGGQRDAPQHTAILAPPTRTLPTPRLLAPSRGGSTVDHTGNLAGRSAHPARRVLNLVAVHRASARRERRLKTNDNRTPPAVPAAASLPISASADDRFRAPVRLRQSPPVSRPGSVRWGVSRACSAAGLTDRFGGRGHVSGRAMVGAESAGCARWPPAATIVCTLAHFG